LSSFSLGTNVFGTDSITNFSNGMSGQSSTAQSAAGAVTDAAGTELADFQELASQYGVTSMEGLGDGISSQAGTVGADTDMVAGTADEILKQFSGGTDVFGVNAAGGFGDGMSSQTGVVGQDAKTLTDKVDSELSDNDYSESGKTIGRTFGSGLSSMTDWVGEQAKGIVEKVRSYFPNSPAKEGPLSGMGWTKLKRSGTALIKHWGDGMGAGNRLSTTLPVLNRRKPGRSVSDQQLSNGLWFHCQFKLNRSVSKSSLPMILPLHFSPEAGISIHSGTRPSASPSIGQPSSQRQGINVGTRPMPPLS
jgi:hypothetical protein